MSNMVLLASGSPVSIARLLGKTLNKLTPGEYEVRLYRVEPKQPLPGDVGMAEMPAKMTINGNNLGVPVTDLEGLIS